MERRCYGCMKKKQQSICEHCGYPETAQNDVHQLPLGTVLRNQYVVGKVLGQGGFGITYLGWDKNLDEPIAIKEYFPNGQVSRNAHRSTVLECTCAGNQFQDGRERFMNEARTLAKLRKVGNIVQVMSFFEENNTAYIVMEYVEGTTLLQYIQGRGGRLTASETFTILKPVIKALHRVHEAGMIHRDISPDNIMLQSDGTVKLLDFGTARDTDASGGQLAHSTQAVLKHGFAPMEQYAGGRAIDRRADEYALCATVYFCLTGAVPPDAPSQIMDGAQIQWDSVPGLTESHRQVLKRGTSVRADDRYPNLEALYEALFGTVTENTVQTDAPPPGPKKPESFTDSGKLPESISEARAPFSSIPETTPLPEPPAAPAPHPHWAPAPPEEILGKDIPEAPVSVSNTPSPKKRNWLLLGIAAVAAVVILCAALMLGGNDAETPGNWEENILMDDIVSYRDDEKYPVFNSRYLRDEIVSITFLDSQRKAPADSWDVSAAKDKSVLAWAEPAGKQYNLFIAGNGGVKAPASCDWLFAHYRNVKTILFNNAFHVTADTTSFAGMFSGCNALETLDVSSFDTSGATDMGGMFQQCKSLTQLNLSNFNTSSVTDMSFMFSSCESLGQLHLDSFDTSCVTDMSAMFSRCGSLSSLNLAHFNTSKVEDMSGVFEKCSAELELGNWETDSVLQTGAPALYESYYDKFMDPGRKYNGQPWEDLFKK